MAAATTGDIRAPAVPEALVRIVEAWRARSCPAQPGIPWPRQRWSERFPQHARTLDALPEPLNRAAVRQACIDAPASPEAAEGGFLAVMVWGYGVVGYGPYRVHRILSTTPDAAARLCEAARIVVRAGVLAGYEQMASPAGGLRYLGPAFGTKYLFFCSPPTQPALILDRLVAAWLAGNAELRLEHVPWSTFTYSRYIERMYAWAEAMGVGPADLEECIFTAQATLAGSQWGVSSLFEKQRDDAEGLLPGVDLDEDTGESVPKGSHGFGMPDPPNDYHRILCDAVRWCEENARDGDSVFDPHDYDATEWRIGGLPDHIRNYRALAFAFKMLDEWIRTGGELPGAWGGRIPDRRRRVEWDPERGIAEVRTESEPASDTTESDRDASDR